MFSSISFAIGTSYVWEFSFSSSLLALLLAGGVVTAAGASTAAGGWTTTYAGYYKNGLAPILSDAILRPTLKLKAKPFFLEYLFKST